MPHLTVNFMVLSTFLGKLFLLPVPSWWYRMYTRLCPVRLIAEGCPCSPLSGLVVSVDLNRGLCAGGEL